MSNPLESHLQHQVEHSGRFFWHRLRWKAVREYLPSGRPYALVDVGAGAGLLGHYLARDRPLARYHFVEPIESLRDMLRGTYGPDADLGDTVDFAGASFVTLLDVLEHQENDHEFLADLVSKMPTGSTLIMTVPALQRLWSQWDVSLGHFRRYDKTSLLSCAEGLGLAFEEVSFLFPEMLPLAMVRARTKKPGAAIDEDQAEFPELPGAINDVLYGMGTVSLRLRTHWGAGTSLLAVATVQR